VKAGFLSQCYISELSSYLIYWLVYNYTSHTTWVSYYNFTTIDWESKYLNSLYWSLVTMVTVGYGDLIFKGEIEISIPNPSNGNNSMFKNVLKVRKKLRFSA